MKDIIINIGNYIQCYTRKILNKTKSTVEIGAFNYTYQDKFTSF